MIYRHCPRHNVPLIYLGTHGNEKIYKCPDCGYTEKKKITK